MPPVRGEQSRVVYGKYGRLSRFVGRGLDPAADVCFVFTFSGKRQNPVRLYKIWFLHSPYVFLFDRPKRKRKTRR